MPAKLTAQKCVACRADSPPVSPAQAAEFKLQVPDWQVVKEDGMPRLQRTFKFPDFLQALAFTQRVGEMAEREDHHPRIVTEWGSVTVTWWTHTIRNLHVNDYIGAAKTDRLVKA